jgi:putative polyketide hydroxylase
MEIFRQWGLAEEVRAAALPPERAQGFGWMTRLNGVELGRLMFADGNDSTGPHDQPGPETPCFCPQHAYEPILLGAAAAHPSVTVEFDREVETVDQDGHQVRLGVRHLDRDVTEEVRALYVVAADGAGSPTRERLGIGETATARFAHSVNVHFRADLAAYVDDKPFMLFWIVNGDTQGTIGAASRDQTRWTYNFDADNTAEYSDEAIALQVRQAVGAPDLDVEVLDVLRWDYDQAVSNRWRLGRVLLAGDAAHRFPPHGAFGMNSGVQDANNLAWKLAHVSRGLAGDGLLDTYEAERKPVAELNSAQALANTRSLGETGWHGAHPEELAAIEMPIEGRELRGRIGAAVSNQRAHLHSDGQQYGTVYTSAAVVPDGTAPVESTVGEYRETGFPGARAPHVWLRRSGVERLSTVDLWDGGFALLVGAAGDLWLRAASAAADRFVVHLTAHQIGPELGLADDGDPWTQKYGVPEDGAVLVRPDGHVGARFAQLPADPCAVLDEAVGRILQIGMDPGPFNSLGEA